MPERDVGTVVAYSLSRGWTVLMLHLLPEEHKIDCGDRTDGQRGSQRGERVMCGVRTREDPKPDQRNQTTHSQRTERGEGDLWVQVDLRGELVVRVGWRLTDRGLGREEGKWGEGVISEIVWYLAPNCIGS